MASVSSFATSLARANIESMIITNERIILRHPHALGLKKDYIDYSYRDITNATLDKGIVRSTIKLALGTGKSIRESIKRKNIWSWRSCQAPLQKRGMGSSERTLANSNRPFQLDVLTLRNSHFIELGKSPSIWVLSEVYGNYSPAIDPRILPAA